MDIKSMPIIFLVFELTQKFLMGKVTTKLSEIEFKAYTRHILKHLEKINNKSETFLE